MRIHWQKDVDWNSSFPFYYIELDINTAEYITKMCKITPDQKGTVTHNRISVKTWKVQMLYLMLVLSHVNLWKALWHHLRQNVSTQSCQVTFAKLCDIIWSEPSFMTTLPLTEWGYHKTCDLWKECKIGTKIEVKKSKDTK